MKQLIILAIAAIMALPSVAVANTQLERLVGAELRYYGVEQDVSTLTAHQLASIFAIMNNQNSQGEKRSAIKSIVEGGLFSRPPK